MGAGSQAGRIMIVVVVALAVVADAVSCAGERSKTYKLEKVIDDLRVLTNIPGGPEEGSATRFFGPMIFVNNKVGWVDSAGFLGKTVDGGKTWIGVGSRVSGHFFFLNEKLGWTGWGLHADSFGRTVDGGVTWTMWKLSKVPCCGDFFFVDSEIGWTLARRGQINQTTDGGRTWKRQRSGTTSTLTALYFINRSVGWVISANGEILHTRDGGKHWGLQQGKTGIHLSRIKFWDDKIGFAVGFTHTIRGEPQGVILYTADGGKNWKRPEPRLPIVQKGLLLWNILIISPKECWVVGFPGVVLQTTDAGRHWKIINLDKPSPVPSFGSAALVEQDGREAILILASKGGLYRIWLNP